MRYIAIYSTCKYFTIIACVICCTRASFFLILVWKACSTIFTIISVTIIIFNLNQLVLCLDWDRLIQSEWKHGGRYSFVEQFCSFIWLHFLGLEHSYTWTDSLIHLSLISIKHLTENSLLFHVFSFPFIAFLNHIELQFELNLHLY